MTVRAQAPAKPVSNRPDSAVDKRRLGRKVASPPAGPHTHHPRPTPLTSPPQAQADYQCSRCHSRPATVCHECVRAIALMWFGSVARHPESGTSCQICEAGPAQLCGECFVQAVTESREQLRSAGMTIGEPAWALPSAHQRLADIQRPEEEQP